MSNKLLWNETGLIVITRTSESDQNSYIVPKKNVRHNLADLTVGGVPKWTLMVDLNNKGDLLGQGGPEYFTGNDWFVFKRQSIVHPRR